LHRRVVLVKDVVYLSGPGSSGKTETFDLVVKGLMARYPHAVPSHRAGRRDIRVILTIRLNVEVEVKVGIESQGDPGDRVRLLPSLRLFVDQECDVVVCACRTSGPTLTAVESLVEDGYTPHRFDKVKEKDRTKWAAQNADMAGKIVKAVTEVIEAAAAALPAAVGP
jgi:hypothetical protein